MVRRRSPPALTKADYERLAEFRHVLRQFLAFSERAAQAAGLTAQHHQALLAIKGYPGRNWVTVGELAERLGIKPHSAVELLNRLEERNLVCRRADADDRRQVMVEVTDEAEAILADLSVAHREELRRLAPLFSALLSDGAPDPTSANPARKRD